MKLGEQKETIVYSTVGDCELSERAIRSLTNGYFFVRY